jgi:membrane fusion protein (multidrug efflux system)
MSASKSGSLAGLRQRGRQHRGILTLLAVLGCAALALPWAIDRWTHVWVTDSRIAADLVTVSSETSGRILRLPVVAGDKVTRGQLLAVIDQTDTTLELRSLDAQALGIEAQQRQLRAEQTMVRAQTTSRIAEAQARVAAALAEHASSLATLERARNSLTRISGLARHGAISEQALEDARAELGVARQRERAAGADIEKERANLAVTRLGEAQLTVLERRIEALDAEQDALGALRQRKEVDLGRHEIRAGFDGVVDAVFMKAGEFASRGSRLLIYHDPEAVWIDANVKETDVARLRVGARATVKVDAYPGDSFEARIDRMSSATTSLFALLPSPNPSGNFTKITQRLPIRLAIEHQDERLRPGMMVELRIDVD